MRAFTIATGDLCPHIKMSLAAWRGRWVATNDASGFFEHTIRDAG